LKCSNGYVKPTIKCHAGPPLDQLTYTRFDNSSDSGGDGRLGDFKGRTMGIGPVVSYILPHGKNTFVAELRWLPETSVKNRLEGDYIWLKVVYQF